jgi:hypothetical protein
LKQNTQCMVSYSKPRSAPQTNCLWLHSIYSLSLWYLKSKKCLFDLNTLWMRQFFPPPRWCWVQSLIFVLTYLLLVTRRAGKWRLR